MKYLVTRGEDRVLDSDSRRGLRGSFVALSHGVTQYELSGPARGELIVFVGGLTVPLAYWDGVASLLHAHGYRTLTYSAYGRGCSDRVKTAYVEGLFVRQLAELIEKLGAAPRRHLVGTSMGALVAMAYAGDYRSSLATLTLVGPAGLNRQPAAQRWALGNDAVATFVAKHFGQRLLEGHMSQNVGDPASLDRLTTMVRESFRYQGTTHAFFDTLQNFPLFGRSELYRATGKLGLPTMLVWGKHDRVTPIRHLDEVRALLAPQQCHVIEPCGHMAPLERPHDVAAMIASFAAAARESAHDQQYN